MSKTPIAAIAAALMLSGCGGGASVSEQDAPSEKAPMDSSPAAYEIVEEKNISYANCRRVAYKIKVADGASPESVEAAQQQIIDEQISNWDDITVWTYNESDTDEYIKNSRFTVDMAEYSTCQ